MGEKLSEREWEAGDEFTSHNGERLVIVDPGGDFGCYRCRFNGLCCHTIDRPPCETKGWHFELAGGAE